MRLAFNDKTFSSHLRGTSQFLAQTLGFDLSASWITALGGQVGGNHCRQRYKYGNI